MLNICGSNLIPIFITILCCGAIFIYFNLRLTELKFSVEKQNRVLTSFITNVQQDIRMGGMPLATSLAAPEALVAAKNFEEEKYNEKIVVSDDEDDDDSDSDTSDSDSDTEDEGDEIEEVKNIKIINIPELNVEGIIPISFEVLSGIVVESSNDVVNNSANESSITEIIDEPLPLDDTTTTYEQMKVDELRKIATDKNLATKDEIRKYKKPELLLLLKK
jgi:hypothetical protein